MEIMKTTDYFGMKDDELLEVRNENMWTREECKLFDEALKVTFFDDVEEWEKEKDDYEKWINSAFPDMKCKAILETINKRIAVLYS